VQLMCAWKMVEPKQGRPEAAASKSAGKMGLFVAGDHAHGHASSIDGMCNDEMMVNIQRTAAAPCLERTLPACCVDIVQQ
jgi:hypothetical protein